jgi:aspartyl-tRNA(Asn)/glutamyl-tRNA(Gln) amidotransferase subunit A
VSDAALMMNVMAGPDERDHMPLSADTTDYVAACKGGVKGLRVAWSENLSYATIHPEVTRITNAAAKTFADDLGCHLDSADPVFEKPEEYFGVFWILHFGTLFRTFLPQWERQMDPGLVAMIKQIDSIKAYDCGQALMKRASLWDVMCKSCQRYDLLLTPTLGVAAFAVGVDHPTEIEGKPITWGGWLLTYAFNLTGLPAATVPCGFTSEGLPVGLQIVGRCFSDASVLRASAAFEQAKPWVSHRPEIRT